MLILINILKLIGNLKEKASSICLGEFNMFYLPESLVFLLENMNPYQFLEKCSVRFVVL